MPASVISAPFLRLPSIHSLFDLSVGCSLQLTASAISVWLTGWLAHTHALSLSLSLALRSTVYRWTARTQRQRRTAPKSMLALNVNGNATKASPFSFASPLPPPLPTLFHRFLSRFNSLRKLCRRKIAERGGWGYGQREAGKLKGLSCGACEASRVNLACVCVCGCDCDGEYTGEQINGYTLGLTAKLLSYRLENKLN